MKLLKITPLMLAGALLPLAGCGEFEAGPLGPDGPSLTAVIPEDIGAVRVLKHGPEGVRVYFEASATGGNLLYPSFFLEPGILSEGVIWRAVDPLEGVSDVTVTELEQPGVQLDSIVVWRTSRDNAAAVRIAVYTGVNTATIDVDYDRGAYIKFFNSPDEPDEPGGGSEGCTPGYWKQSQHFDSWVGYAPGDVFSDVFGNAAAFPGQTLLDVLNTGGGGDAALGRHSVAALLNTSGGVDYGMTPADVIDAFNAAFGTADAEATKNMFEGFNERGCPLD